MKTNRSRTIKNQFWLPLVAAGLTLAGYQAAAQTTIAKWTFENLTIATGSVYTNGNAHVITNVPSEIGNGIASGYHAGVSGTGNAVFSTVSGNGSAKALTSNGWTNNPLAPSGDYYQFAVSTVGFTNIGFSFDAVGSSTGPRDFIVKYSTDGVNFTQFGSGYTVLSTPSWSASTAQSGESYTNDLSSITTLANASVVYIRLVMNSNTSIGGAAVGTGGTSRVDNFNVFGTIAGPPQFVTAPANSTNFFGDSVNWTITAGGDAPLTYQWYTNSFPLTPVTDGSSGYGVGTIAGSTSASLALTFLNTNQSGNYRVVVSNARGSITSSVIRLQVNVRQPIVTNITYIRKLHDTNFVVTDTTNIYVIEGIVTTPVNLVSGPTEVESFFLQDTNGVGCDVFFRGGFTFPSQGDRVRVTAPLLQFNGLTEVNPINGNPAHNVEVLSSGNALPVPQYFDFTTWPSATNLEEVLEGKYMVVSNVFIGVASNANGHFTASGSVTLTNKSGKIFSALVPNNPVIDLVGAGLPGTFAKSIRGVISQSQTSGTVLTNGYSILLAQSADLEIGSPVTANPDAFTIVNNAMATLLPLTNDVVLSPDTNARTLTVTAVTPSAGVATIDNGTNILFTPDLNFVGTVTINYTATDNYGYTSDSVITVTVVSPLPASPIPLTAQKITAGLVLSWTNAAFYLQSAPDVTGPYSYMFVTSPYTNDMTASPNRFFRLTTQAPPK